jgi:hypothetical protein
MCFGEAQEEKCLDHFLLFEDYLEEIMHFPKWIYSFGDFVNIPIILEMYTSTINPPIPLKLNSNSLEDPSIIEVIRYSWIPFNLDQPESPSL